MKTREELTEKIAMMLWHVTLQQRLPNNPSTTSDRWEECSEPDKDEWREWASVAVGVAVDEMLPDPTECDYEKELDAVLETWDWNHQSLRCAITQDKAKQLIRDALCIFWSSRRSRYVKRKTIEERVTVVKWVHDPTRWIALVDDWNMGNTGGFKDKKDAEIYRLGLIQYLKEQGQ